MQIKTIFSVCLLSATMSIAAVGQDSKTYERWSELFRRHDNKILLLETTAALQKDPRNATALRFRTIAYSFLNQIALSDGDLKVLGTVLPSATTSEDYEVRCYFFRRSSKYDEAATECGKAVQLNSLNVMAHFGKARIHQAKGETDEAIASFGRAAELDPKFSDAFVERGRIYYGAKKDLDKALADFNKAIELLPSVAGFYNDRGVVYQDKNLMEQAMADYTKAVELDPLLPSPLLNLADIYGKRGQCEKGMPHYNKAIELDPKFAAAYRKRGACYSDQRKWAAAIADFGKAIQLDPKDGLSYFARGFATRTLKRDENAMTPDVFCGIYTDYSKSIELIPSDPYYRVLRAELLEDFAYVSKVGREFPCFPKLQPREFAMAGLKDADKAAEFGPKYFSAFYWKGRLHLFLEEYDLALQALGKAVELEPRSSDVYCVRARVYGFMGNTAARDADLAIYRSSSKDECPAFKTFGN